MNQRKDVGHMLKEAYGDKINPSEAAKQIIETSLSHGFYWQEWGNYVGTEKELEKVNEIVCRRLNNMINRVRGVK